MPLIFLFPAFAQQPSAPGASPPQQQQGTAPSGAPPASAGGLAAASSKNASAAPDYSKESAVIEETRQSFRFENDGAGGEVDYERFRVQSPQAVQSLGQLVINYNAASDKPHVDFVRVHKPDGKIAEAGPDAVQDLSSPVERIGPVYTDMRQLHITVPDLSAGDTLEYQISVTTYHPLVPGQFFLQWNAEKQLITLKDTLIVNAPAERQLEVKTAKNIPAPQIREENGRRIYTWETSFTRRPPETHGSSDNREQPAAEPNTPSVQLSTFANWEQVGDWYAGLARPRAAVTDSIRAEAAELTKGLATPEEKAQAIFAYVSQHIRYVSISLGLGAYQPHAAANVLANQYGDCKDQATLLESLLDAAGIESYPVLIGAQGKLDPDVPSPAQFDHLISIVVIGGKQYWADTTPSVAPFNFLMAQLRDKQALAIPPEGKPALVRTPENPPFVPEQIVRVTGAVDSFGRFKGKLEYSATGDTGIYLRSAIRSVPGAYWDKFASLFVSRMFGDSFKGGDYHVAQDVRLGHPFSLSGDFSTANFVNLARKDVTLTVSSNSIDVPGPDEPKKGSTEPMAIGAFGEETETWQITFPPQIHVTLPVPVQIMRDFGEYASEYSQSGQTVTVTRRILLRQNKIPPARYDDLEAFRAAVLADKDQSLALVNSQPGLGAAPAGMSAADLYQAGLSAENARNYPEAAKLFNAAAEKDQSYDGVWSSLGYCYVTMREYQKAVDALNKAIAQNPYDSYAYNNLGRAYWGLDKYDDAMKEFRKQIEINPLDRYAHANLAALAFQQKDYATAQKEYQTAVQIAPNQYGLDVGLGGADLRLHQDDAALAAFHTAIEHSPTPPIWNDVAYSLAEAGSHLDIAETYSRNSIRSVEAELDAVTLEPSMITARSALLMTGLAAYWDTMGWIKFKQGDMAAAQQYVRAAWALGDASEVGDHLGQIYEKEGKRSKAIRAYALALLYDSPPAETRGRLEALVGKDKADGEIEAARQDSAARREAKLPNPGKLDGRGEYWVLLSTGDKPDEPKITGVEFLSAKDVYEKPLSPKAEQQFRDLADALRSIHLPFIIAAGEQTKILVRGVLACTTLEKSCTFTPFAVEDTFRTFLRNPSASAP